MALNLFGPLTKENIKVSYVDSVLGLINDVSITQANEYARGNPEATFIFKDGNQSIQYLNIDEVNNLNPDVLVPTDPCSGPAKQSLTAGGTGGAPVTVGGTGGTPVTAGGTPVTVGGTGGTPVTVGGTPVTVGGTPVTAGGTGGTQVTAGGTGGTPVTVGGTPVTAGGTGGTSITAGETPVTAGVTGGTQEIGPPTIQFFGGNGIGAAGNPIIGTDGSLLAVDIVSGGYGYQYPPLVSVRDVGNNGAGATLIAVLSENILNDNIPSILINELITIGETPVTAGGTGGTPVTVGGTPVTAGGTGGTPVTVGGTPVTAGGTGGTQVTAGGTGGTPVTVGGTPVTAGGSPVTAGGTGGTPVTVGGTPVTVGGTGGTPVTVGGTGGTPVTAGGTPITVGRTPITAGGTPVTVGGTGGTPVTVGGTGGTPVTAGGTGGTPVTVGGTGGTPVTVGGTGGTPVTVGGTPVTAGGTGGTPVTVGGTGGTPVTVGGTGGTPVTAASGQVVLREVRGRGVVVEVVVTDPGNGYLSPTPPIQVLPTPISPPSGAPTGINARFLPQFEIVRDPIVIDPQKLLQVTDLVGLKQTGYVNGRAYYGAVYYDNGVRYAGFYETVGEPVRVYDTLRESIIAQVTTPPSAILRQGTDIRSNNPLLNIPGTVQSTINSSSIIGAGDISTPSVPFIQEPVQDSIYPVSLRLKRVLVEDPGINYNITDQIRVIPSNGAVLEPVFGSFGRVIKVAVIDPGFGFTEYPRIEMFTPL